MKRTLALLAFAAATPLAAQQATPLQSRVEAELAKAATGTRFGLVVTDAEGREIVAVNPDQRFIPASNTKIVTTAAAFATLSGIEQPDAAGGAAVRIEDKDVYLTGRGDARLSSAPDCKTNCLAELADAVAARTRRVDNVIGDASLYPDSRWSAGMSWNNIPTSSGTAASALSLDDNEIAVTVTPGEVDQPVRLAHPSYLRVYNRAVTVAAGGKTDLVFTRRPFDRMIHLNGTIAADAQPQVTRLGIDDPADYAASRLIDLLRERGVRVKGVAKARYRILDFNDDPQRSDYRAPMVRAAGPAQLATLTPPPLIEDVRTINKVSQNLHAELLLRRIGYVRGTGSVAHGLAQVEAMFAAAGVPRTAWDFSDGSGMSTYNRIAPRGMVKLLQWIAAQPWGAKWRETLPVGGVDGTLARRFKGTVLEGRIFAKTGTINATNALAGYMTTKSGKTLTFAAYANDVPSGTAATPAMDAALVAIAEAN